MGPRMLCDPVPSPFPSPPLPLVFRHAYKGANVSSPAIVPVRVAVNGKQLLAQVIDSLVTKASEVGHVHDRLPMRVLLYICVS
jgi:hypothetical protein